MKALDSIPAALQLLVDAAIDSLHTGHKTKAELLPLYEWIVDERWDEMAGPWWFDEGNYAVNLKARAPYWFNDQSLRDAEGRDDDEAVDDRARVAYCRRALDSIIEEADGDVCATLHCVPLEPKNGRKAFLGCLVEIPGPGGPECNWQGVFRDTESFLAHLRDSGFLLSNEMEQLTDEHLLALWQKKPRFSRRHRPAVSRNVVVSVEWGYEAHECPMALRTWRRLVAGKPVVRKEPYWYEGDRFTGVWQFNHSGPGTLLVTYDDEGVGFDGSLEDVDITVDGEAVRWADVRAWTDPVS